MSLSPSFTSFFLLTLLTPSVKCPPQPQVQTVHEKSTTQSLSDQAKNVSGHNFSPEGDRNNLNAVLNSYGKSTQPGISGSPGHIFNHKQDVHEKLGQNQGNSFKSKFKLL